MLSRFRRLAAHRRSLLGIPFAPVTGALVTCGLPVVSACGTAEQSAKAGRGGLMIGWGDGEGWAA